MKKLTVFLAGLMLAGCGGGGKGGGPVAPGPPAPAVSWSGRWRVETRITDSTCNSDPVGQTIRWTSTWAQTGPLVKWTDDDGETGTATADGATLTLRDSWTDTISGCRISSSYTMALEAAASGQTASGRIRQTRTNSGASCADPPSCGNSGTAAAEKF